MTNDIINSNVRIAISPLAYERLRLAKDREMLCDYNNGKIYIKNGDNIYDITSKIKETIVREGMSVNNCTVFIEDIGNVQVGDAISHIMYNLINITDKGSESGELISGYNVDFTSITNKDKLIQIVGFSSAADNTIPVKIGDTIEWRPYSSGEDTDVHVYDVEPIENTLQLLGKQVQRTNELDHDIQLNIYTPVVRSEYFHFKWKLNTSYDFNLELIFQPNIIFEYSSDAAVDKGCTYIFDFDTFNYGQSWLVKKTKYNQDTYTESIVNAIKDRVYNKDEVNALISWLTPEDQG